MVSANAYAARLLAFNMARAYQSKPYRLASLFKQGIDFTLGAVHCPAYSIGATEGKGEISSRWG